MLTALTSPNVIPGDTIYLRGGTYTGNFICSVKGTAENPVVYKAYPGERAIIDGSLIPNDYTEFWGIELAGSSFTDRSAANGVPKVTLGGKQPKFINCIIHDGNQGFSGGTGCDGYELYGNLIYHNGYDSDQGHGLYCQHDSEAGNAVFRNNIVFDNFGYGFHLYGNPVLRNFIVDKNIGFNSGGPREIAQRNILLGGYAGVVDPTLTDNRCYSALASAENMRLGWGEGNEVTGATVTGNYSAQAQTGLYFVDVTAPTVTGNSIYGAFTGLVTGQAPDDLKDDYAAGNTYGAATEWTDTVFVEPNTYDATRAHVAIFNKTEANTVAVDVTGIYAAGDTIEAHNVQDYFTDIQTLTVSEAVAITVNMQAVNRTVATPVGMESAPPTTFPKFGAFVLVKVA